MLRMGIKTNLSACPAQIEMSALESSHRRPCSLLRPQALAPRMVRPQRDRAPGLIHRLGLSRLHGPRGNRMKVERPALVRDPHCPVPMLFPQHTGGLGPSHDSDRVLPDAQ